nr:NAD-dependent protein deacylase [Maliibacterium massiliense]
MNEQIQALQRMVDASRHIVFFGGAGVSTESGIPDFRSVDGLYHQQFAYPPEEILSHDFYLQHPEAFFAFYRAKMVAPNAQPNAAHRKLAQMERAGKLDCVITQNIDGLHQMAGSRRVLELHGSVQRNHCMRCGRAYGIADVLRAQHVPRCSCGGVIKPDVVLYGEYLDDGVLAAARRAVRQADLLMVGGTSLEVQPAAGLVCDYRGERLVLINKSATRMDALARLHIMDAIGVVLGQLRID